jgi:hypothetical protein
MEKKLKRFLSNPERFISKMESKRHGSNKMDLQLLNYLQVENKKQKKFKSFQ